MPAATNKLDLIAVTGAEYARFVALLEKVPKELREREVDGTSIKDIVGHRAHWIELFLGWYSDGQAGRDVALPAPGYKWNELKRYNADLRKRQAGLSWAEVRVMLDVAYTRLIDFLNGETDGRLYGAPMAGGKSKWTTGRWAEAAGASHFRSGAKYVRAVLRSARAETGA